jgi:hypothetical protein
MLCSAPSDASQRSSDLPMSGDDFMLQAPLASIRPMQLVGVLLHSTRPLPKRRNDENNEQLGDLTVNVASKLAGRDSA